MTHFELYCLLMLDNVKFVSVALGFVLALTIVLYSCVCLMEDRKMHGSFLKIIIPIFCICLSITIFLPSTKQAAAIYLIPRVVNNQNVQNMTGDGFKILQMHVQEYLQELQQKSLPAEK